MARYILAVVCSSNPSMHKCFQQDGTVQLFGTKVQNIIVPGQSRKGKGCSKTGNLVFFLEILVIHFVPGHPGTEEFVPGHLLLPLSQDKGT